MNDNDFSPAAPSGPPVLAVSALNQAVARLLERNFPLIWVSGEVSNFTRAASGHWYFTLKDAGAQVRSVMFRGRAQYADFIPREGDRVEVRTLVTLYAPRGDYQLSVESIRRAGVGNLYEAFLRLKATLEAEGLFATERKRPLPVFARCIGIVTSLQAAALRDILTTLQRRAPHVRVVLYPTPVQGEGAAAKIAQAIRTAGDRVDTDGCDVLLVCRGGGSIEDLWSFNDEAVARAIVASPIPVVSGVGHETDITIADFAADLRAPTPTAAAELAAAPREDWLASLQASWQAVQRARRRRTADDAQQLDWLARRLVSPAAYIAQERLKLRGMQVNLRHAVNQPLGQARNALQHLQARLQHTLPDHAALRARVGEQARRLAQADRQGRVRHGKALQGLQAQLELLNPQRTLERGYAIVTDAKGAILRSPAQLQPRASVDIRLAEGSAQVGIASVQTSLER